MELLYHTNQAAPGDWGSLLYMNFNLIFGL